MTDNDSKAQDAVIGLYERHAAAYDLDRSRELQEGAWLDRFLTYVRPGGTVLDVGCGMGEPIASYLIQRGVYVVGVDSSPSMIDRCRQRFPTSEWIVSDMRELDLGRRFDGLLAWDSLFHLSIHDQRRMFARFAMHAEPMAPLMFTSGTSEGVAVGSYCEEPLYHASLAPAEYRERLTASGFVVCDFVPDDATCGHHTVWLAAYGESAVVTPGSARVRC